MKKSFFLLFSALTSLSARAACTAQPAYRLVIHGGAGTWNISAEQKKVVTREMEALLGAGQERLENGDSALDVVQSTVRRMEDSGLFNAGKGSVRNSEKDVEMDASIMDGRTLKAGAVGVVRTLKNPIDAARRVMDKTRHVLLA